ncbi:hypothetical protein IG631_23551 [Alternaria alternata]|nr:hypothetical protein IG631_23551 [Alternaria alternata]
MLTPVRAGCVRRASVSKLISVHQRHPTLSNTGLFLCVFGGAEARRCTLGAKLAYVSLSLYVCRTSNVMSTILPSALCGGRPGQMHTKAASSERLLM